MKYLLIFLVVLVIFIISITLGAKNDQIVTFNYLLAQGDFRVSTLLASLFGAGFILGWVICGLFWLRMRLALSHARRKIKRLEAQYVPANSVTTARDKSVVKE
ncbi:inner membrane protein [Tatumella ptyseos ATCC 33301]|uniref:Lipopolysaccharide assembly protein A n=2 Tax=Tatumella ptyseos TaxID=82987 RepID=A0A085JEF9_9GAMM|nr:MULTISPECIES: LapA family protein [Tatumella]KFD18855.1 inner membrane protein [Tatumella ptyseos ATCC 33301]SQK75005.1 Inner membrane protein yciS [Tatumella ptyseos]